MDQFISKEVLDILSYHSTLGRSLKQISLRKTPLPIILDDIEKFPEEDTYETIAGFMMYMLKSIPKKGAVVDFENYTFEVVDVDRFKIDQLLVTRKNSTENIN